MCFFSGDNGVFFSLHKTKFNRKNPDIFCHSYETFAEIVEEK